MCDSMLMQGKGEYRVDNEDTMNFFPQRKQTHKKLYYFFFYFFFPYSALNFWGYCQVFCMVFIICLGWRPGNPG